MIDGPGGVALYTTIVCHAYKLCTWRTTSRQRTVPGDGLRYFELFRFLASGQKDDVKNSVEAGPRLLTTSLHLWQVRTTCLKLEHLTPQFMLHSRNRPALFRSSDRYVLSLAIPHGSGFFEEHTKKTRATVKCVNASSFRAQAASL